MMGNDFCYTVTAQAMFCGCCKCKTQRFEDEDTALAVAAKLADVLDEDGTLFDIDVYYVDIDHRRWLAGYSNLPEE